MNNTRRKELRKAVELLERANDLINEVRCILDDIIAEEEEAYYNMPESIQESERGQANEEAREHLENASYIDIEDSIIEMQNEIEMAIDC